MSGRVAGKVIVVTGAASGQGAAEAARLAAEGAEVVAGDLAAAWERAPARPSTDASTGATSTSADPGELAALAHGSRSALAA